ncbi:MAG: hypothetical protein JNJ63_07660 [Hyphomonadaceae bacterium]|nr:hypothetical protein [Hyphomonadaceae bacterium]
MTLKQRYTAIAAVMITVFALGASFNAADARGRRGQASVETQRGTATARSEVRRSRGTRTRDAAVTGANGRQRSVHDERSVDRANDSYTHDRVTTYNDGSQRSVEVDVLHTGEGQYSASREVTGRNGETRVQTGDFTRTQTENGHSLSGDTNTSNRGQIDYQRDVTHADGARSVNSSATFEDGTAITRASSGSCANGSCTSSGVVTGRNGDQTSWDQTRTRTENGAELSREVTYADGTTRSVDRERTGNGDGTGTITRTVTGRDGETRTQTGEYEVEHTP